MSDILGISSTAISAYQRALTTVSNNIANVNTDGYSRQVTVLEDNTPAKSANMYVGTGVLVDTIKRQYDAFAEANLRSSTSDLGAQTPMVDYTKQVVDVMGDQTSGLSSALDSFFSAADSLAADPASTTERTGFLSSASTVASRFSEVSGQLQQIATNVNQAVQDTVDKVNTLTTTLAQINQSMTRSPTLAGQPSALLDQRDKALRDLSELVKIKVGYSTNGMVTVSLGSTLTQGVAVDGVKSRSLGVDQSVSGKIDFVLDPYGKNTESVADLSGGELGGYQTLVTQVISPAVDQLNSLAQTFVDETNTIQKNGLDGYGDTGTNLFTLDATATQKAAGIQVALTDGMRIATASQFSVTEGSSNVSSAKASVSYAGTKPTLSLSNSSIVNNPSPSANVTFKVDGSKAYASVTSVSAGVSSVFYLDDADPGQQLQVLTREGQQLMGQTLTETQKYQMLTTANGFSSNINYSDQYLNKTGTSAYRDEDYFYGSKAEVLYKSNYDSDGNVTSTTPLSATETSSRLSSLSNIAAGALQINGVALGAYTTSGTTGVTIAGVSKGNAVDYSDFGFSMKIGSKTLSLSSITDANGNAPTNMTDLASDLQYQLRASEGTSALTVSVTNNGDLKISDGTSPARAISTAGFTLASPIDASESAGTVSLDTDATRLAAWYNGSTQATLDGINFGTLTSNSSATGQFSSFSMSLGNQDFDIQMPTTNAPTDVASLATYLQTQLRTMDGSNNISVTAANGQLVLNDKAGRELQSLTLTPSSNTQGASAGTQTITQSNVAQTKVRATLTSQVSAPVKSLDFSKGLSINGVAINGYTNDSGQWVSGYNNANQLIKAINQSAAGVTAALDSGGDLVLTNALGAPITLDKQSNGNALNIDAGTYEPTMTLTQVTSDYTVSSSSLDFTQPLSLNGVNITPGVASYALPAADTATPLSVSWTNSSSAAGVTLTGISKGTAANYNGFSFQVNVGGSTLSVPATAFQSATSMADVAVALQRGLQSADNGSALTVQLVNNGQDLQITDSSGRVISGASFALGNGTASNATVGTSLTTAQEMAKQLNADSTFAANYTATINSDGSLHVALSSNSALNHIDLTINGTEINSGSSYDLTPSTSSTSSISWTHSVSSNDSAADLVNQLNSDSDFTSNYKAILSTSGKLLIQSHDGSVADSSVAANFNVTSGSSATTLTASTGVSSRDDLVQRIRDLSGASGVTASVDANGDIVLSTTDPAGTGDITVGPGKNSDGTYANTLSLEPKDYDVATRITADLKTNAQDKDFRISFGSNGQPSDLSHVGLRTAAYIEGGSADDLLVFVTGKGTAGVSASYSGTPTDPQTSLRSQSLSVKFTAANRYNIIDNSTGTVLADRTLDTSTTTPTITFEGLSIKLTTTPSVGDTYQITGNTDGLGNNENMLDMSSLAKQKVVNGKTIGEAYIDQVNSVGNLSQQAQVSQTALQAVKDQAEAARDKISGVTLDDEAADLIRYQQAYQAAAKALQVSTQLFDTIEQLNS